MKMNYLSASQQNADIRTSQSKKQRIKLLRLRPNKRYKGVQQILPPSKQNETKPKQSQVPYIDNAIKIMRQSQIALIQNPSLPIRIDNAYGDYAMSIFRRKDKIKRLQDVPKLFTNEFKSKLLNCLPSGSQSLLQDVISGKVKGSSLSPEIMNKSSKQIYSNRKQFSKKLNQLNQQMKYEYFVDQEPSQKSKAKLLQREQKLRATSMDKLIEHRNQGFLPQITKKKGLIFKSQFGIQNK